ncbi:MAG: hypothetical protein GXY83_06240 [Rhodopirellula sp.]|nr:hypothetical protein [Rhodopirellula sp.]
MGKTLLFLIAAALAAGGCRQGTFAGSAAKGPSPDDVIGKYAQERGLSREEASVTIRQEIDAARAASASRR